MTITWGMAKITLRDYLGYVGNRDYDVMSIWFRAQGSEIVT